MRALVTGATGFVGSRLADALRGRGDEVRCLVRDAGRSAHLRERGFDPHEGDLLRPETLAGAGVHADLADAVGAELLDGDPVEAAAELRP